LKRLKLVKMKRRLSKGIEVLLDFRKIEDSCRKLGIDVEKIKEESSEKQEVQTDLKERPDWRDFEEERRKFDEF
jgi:4'-phosphopantetheinyl transferase EntD